MEIRKEARSLGGGEPSQVQLEAINRLAKGQMDKDQVYVFSVRLCDDRVDREYERFDTAALPELARLFVGKCGVADHRWSAKEQIARIFAAEVVKEDRGSYLKAWAYIRRGGRGDEWIADIQAGIKKEVSVGCAMGRSVCSICGGDYGACGHVKGERYDGEVCCAILKEPMDAYEFSFVAVPAQPAAGVMKGLGTAGAKLTDLAEEFGAQAEYRELAKLAELGRAHGRALRDRVVGLCLALEVGVAEPALRSMAGKLSPEELAEFQKALEERVAERYPVRTQLPAGKENGEFGNEYRI